MIYFNISVTVRCRGDKKMLKGKFFTYETQVHKFLLNFLGNMNQSFAYIRK